MNLEMFIDVLLDALKDSAIIFPFLILTYSAIEFIERKSGVFQKGGFLRGKFAPLLGSLAGVFPQCGISVMTAKLYDSGLVKVGTLLAVFIATSDEAFAILLSSGKFLALILLITCKIVLAVIVGYGVNAIIKSQLAVKYKFSEFKHEEYCRQCGASGKAKNGVEAYLLYPLLHALKTFAFIFCVNLVFGGLVTLIGEDKFVSFMTAREWAQPLIVPLVGLIPNCASSILITELYCLGGIKFGSMVAGLSVNAGVGLAIILKNKDKIKRNIILVSFLYAVSVLAGFLINLFC